MLFLDFGDIHCQERPVNSTAKLGRRNRLNGSPKDHFQSLDDLGYAVRSSRPDIVDMNAKGRIERYRGDGSTCIQYMDVVSFGSGVPD